MKKRVFAMFLALVMLFGLVACGKTPVDTQPKDTTPDNNTTAPAGGDTTTPGTTSVWYGNDDGTPVTLSFWGGVQGEYGYDTLVENFNKEFASVGLQIEYTRYVNDDDGNLQLETYLMGGNDIDIYMGYGGTDRLFTRIDSGLAYDMTADLKAAGFDPIAELGENNVAGYIYNDKYYALPTKYENKNWMVVNADMFKEAGIELPLDGWTYAEFEEAAKKLTKGEGQDKVYGMFWNLNEGWKNAISFVGATLGKYQTYTDETAKATNLNDELWQKGLKLIVDSQDDWAVSLEAEKADSLNFNNTFLEGKAAMSSGIYNLRTIKDLEKYPHDFETALVPYPVPTEADLKDNWSYSDYPGAGDLILINPKSEHIEAAVEFVLWYIQGGMAPLASGGRIPLWKGFDSSKVIDALCQTKGVFNEESIKAYMSVEKTNAYTSIVASADSKIATIKKEEMEAALLGQKTVEQACKDMQTRADELLK